LAPLPLPAQMRDFLCFEKHLLQSFARLRQVRAAAAPDPEKALREMEAQGTFSVPKVWYERPVACFRKVVRIHRLCPACDRPAAIVIRSFLLSIHRLAAWCELSRPRSQVFVVDVIEPELRAFSRFARKSLRKFEDASFNRPFFGHIQLLEPDKTTLNLAAPYKLFHGRHCPMPLAHADEYAWVITSALRSLDALVYPRFERVWLVCAHSLSPLFPALTGQIFNRQLGGMRGMRLRCGR
jgi:hypothetical protein